MLSPLRPPRIPDGGPHLAAFPLRPPAIDLDTGSGPTVASGPRGQFWPQHRWHHSQSDRNSPYAVRATARVTLRTFTGESGTRLVRCPPPVRLSPGALLPSRQLPADGDLDGNTYPSEIRLPKIRRNAISAQGVRDSGKACFTSDVDPIREAELHAS